MSSTSKRKWDQPSEAPAPSISPAGATEAAAAAAAIAAKIAAQFAVGGTGKDPHDGEFTHDIDINDVRNRYMLTKGTTQQQVHEETGGSVSTKGVWYPDRTKATEKDPPLYLHISASTAEVLQKTIDKVNELMTIDLGSLVEDKKDRMREKRKWPEEKLPVGVDSIRNFNVRAKVVGPSGMFVKYIQQETGTRVQIKGLGSGFVDQETGKESDEPMHIHITGPDEGQVARAKVLTEDLLEVVRLEHGKAMTVVHQQQMELHQAQQQYGMYNMQMQGGYAPPPPSAAPPPPPPGEQPPPPPEGASSGGQAPSASSTQADYLAYYAAYGYDVESPQFKEWLTTQQQQWNQGQAQAQPTGQMSQTAPAPPPSEPAPPAPPPPS
ncbi:hypothetical protein BDV98DRAFT_549324 [Pterulicium gracile]|uniref:K Homology domain-containing protein n=1 Tax=Pterulicium gracile TaxID=1884261 RepID=A0A5C3QF50_9AGAR|nr:hypothetical protein BDV98DRAFT_549324 [Pterula gracilis]